MKIWNIVKGKCKNDDDDSFGYFKIESCKNKTIKKGNKNIL